jgi:hypothetical protein
MPQVLSKVHTTEEMVEVWNRDNPHDVFLRDSALGGKMPEWYDLDKWLLRVDDNNKIIARIGWGDRGSHYVLGGLYAIKNYPNGEGEVPKNNSRELIEARESLIVGKPKIASFMAKRGNNASWKEHNKKKKFPKGGWVFNPIEVEGIPKDVLETWAERYDDAWAVRKEMDWEDFAKAIFDDDENRWFNVLKKDNTVRKWFPDSSWSEIKIKDSEKGVGYANVGFQALIRPHYINRGKERNLPYRTDQISTWAELILEKNLPVKMAYWAYTSPLRERVFFFSIMDASEPIYGTQYNVDFDNITMFNSIDTKTPADARRKHSEQFVDIWGNGIERQG